MLITEGRFSFISRARRPPGYHRESTEQEGVHHQYLKSQLDDLLSSPRLIMEGTKSQTNLHAHSQPPRRGGCARQGLFGFFVPFHDYRCLLFKSMTCDLYKKTLLFLFSQAKKRFNLSNFSQLFWAFFFRQSKLCFFPAEKIMFLCTKSNFLAFLSAIYSFFF